jgi:hypothetical protein
MHIEYEDIKISTKQTRLTGKATRRVYYIRHLDRKVGPYNRYGDAEIAMNNAIRATERNAA